MVAVENDTASDTVNSPIDSRTRDLDQDGKVAPLYDVN